MDWKKQLFDETEQPLDRLVDGYSNTSVFRTMAFVGDSLSSGEFEYVDMYGQKSFHDMFDYSWGQHIARRNGLKAYSFSRGGLTAKEYIESFADEMDFWDKGKRAQAYVIALGVNDVLNLNAPTDELLKKLGDLSDIDKADYRNNKPTFVGYYAQIISRYKQIAPDAKFFFVTVPNESLRSNVLPLAIRDVLYGLAKHFDNSYVIDLYRYGPPYDKEFKDKFYLHNHLNPSGYLLTAQLIDSYIDYIIRHNPNDFKQIAFVGKNVEQCKLGDMLIEYVTKNKG